MPSGFSLPSFGSHRRHRILVLLFFAGLGYQPSSEEAEPELHHLWASRSDPSTGICRNGNLIMRATYFSLGDNAHARVYRFTANSWITDLNTIHRRLPDAANNTDICGKRRTLSISRYVYVSTDLPFSWRPYSKVPSGTNKSVIVLAPWGTVPEDVILSTLRPVNPKTVYLLCWEIQTGSSSMLSLNIYLMIGNHRCFLFIWLIQSLSERLSLAL